MVGPSIRTYMRFDDWYYLKTTVRGQTEFPGVLLVRDVLRGCQTRGCVFSDSSAPLQQEPLQRRSPRRL